MIRVFHFGLVALLLGSGAAAGARPFAVDDLLRVEQFAQVLIDPSEHWLVMERREPAGSAPRFDLETHKALTLGRLLVVDLAHPEPARPLIAAEPGTGYVACAFSPHGSRLAVARLRGRIWELGVVTLATGDVEWFGVTPGLPGERRALQWRSEDEIVALVHRGTDLPVYLRAGWQSMADLPGLWEAAALGHTVTATAIGSGRFRSVTPKAAPLQLVRIDVRDARQTEIAAGDLIDFELSPDGRRVAVIQATEQIQPQATDHLGIGTPSRRQRLILIDLDGPRPLVVCPHCDVAGALLNWSPSGRRLLIYARTDGVDWAGGDVLEVDARTATMRRVTTPILRAVVEGPPDFAPVVRADWLGDEPIVYARPVSSQADTPRVDWYRLNSGSSIALTSNLKSTPPTLAAVGRRSIIAMSEGHAWRIDHRGNVTAIAHSKGLQPIAASNPDGGSRARVNRRSATSVFAGSARRESGIEVDFVGGIDGKIAIDSKDMVVPRAAAPGRHMVVAERTDRHGVGTLVLATTNRHPIGLSRINAHLAEVEPARTIAIRHTGPNGELLTSWLFLPPEGMAAQKFPLIVVPYPGMIFGGAPPSWQAPNQPLNNISAQALAGRGFAVLLPSLPRPKEAGSAAAGLADQVLSIVDQVIARDDIDGTRLALWGHSFGGYAAGIIATQTDRFRSIIASAGLFDLISTYGTFLPPRRVHPEDGLSINTMAGWAESGQPRLGGAPWMAPQTYVANSPIFAAGRINTPMLLLQGDQDIASLTQAEEMFSALYRQNKDAILVSYWGEGHVVSSPANLRDLYARVFQWLDDTLDQPAKPEPPG